MQTIGVIGAGTMGSGIAQVMAQHGFDVVLVDVVAGQLKRAIETMDRHLGRAVEKGQLGAAEKEAVLGRIVTADGYDALARADFVVEAVLERFDVKADLFGQLDAICRPDVILASNTSSISITKIAATTERPDRVIGMHFFNPVPLMKLVEMIRGVATSDETAATTRALGERVGKTVVQVSDYPGFVSNRLLCPMINEAAYALMEGVADAKGIDTVMRLGMNHPMGPLELADLIGLDVVLDILHVLEDGLGAKYHPCPLLVKLVDAGHLGRKSGRGFYQYP